MLKQSKCPVGKPDCTVWLLQHHCLLRRDSTAYLPLGGDHSLKVIQPTEGPGHRLLEPEPQTDDRSVGPYTRIQLPCAKVQESAHLPYSVHCGTLQQMEFVGGALECAFDGFKLLLDGVDGLVQARGFVFWSGRTLLNEIVREEVMVNGGD